MFDYGSNRTRAELSALEFENLPYLTVYTLASANIDQSVPVYMPISFRMSLIMGKIKAKHPELFALEFGKVAESDSVYTLASTNINDPPGWLSGERVGLLTWWL